MTTPPVDILDVAARHAPHRDDVALTAVIDNVNAFLRDDAIAHGINLHDPDTLRAAAWGALAGTALVHHLHGCVVGNTVLVAELHGSCQARAVAALGDRARHHTERTNP